MTGDFDCCLVAMAEDDTNRIQRENADVIRAMTDAEKDDVLTWLNDHEPDTLREALNETEGWR